MIYNNNKNKTNSREYKDLYGLYSIKLLSLN